MSAAKLWPTTSILIAPAVTLVTLVWSLPSQAAILAHYDFASSSAHSVDGEPNSVASLFADADGTLDFATEGNPGPSAFKSFGAIAATLDPASSSYFYFTIAPVSGYALNLATLVFDFQKDKVIGDGAKPVVTVDLRSDAGDDDFMTSLGTFTINHNSGQFSVDLAADLGGLRFQNLLTTTEFRFYLFDGANGTADRPGGAHLDNVRLSGDSIVVTPEPASLFAWSALAMVFAGARSSQRRRRGVVA
jgi:hypothetical protein